jgi:transposase
MIPVPSGVRVWLAVGRTDMRKGMNRLALQVQQVLGRDPHAGDLYVFRGTTAAFACRTTLPNAHCVALPWAENHGCSPVPTAVDSAPRRCTA